MVDLKELQSRIDSFFSQAYEKGDPESFRRVAAVLSEYSGRLREDAVEALRERIQSAIHKLQSAQDMAPDELEVLRMCVIGCSEDFSREGTCRSELERLKKLMDDCWLQTQDPAVLLRLARLFEEVTRVLFSLSDHIERKAQIGNFEKTLTDLGIEEREFLIEILKSKTKQDTTWKRGEKYNG
jgi:hypothetical protein